MKMDMRMWIEGVRNSRVKKAMPILSFPSIQLMGITVKELISDSNLQAKGMKLIADRVESLASVSMMDLSVEAETFGSKIKFSDDEVPTVIGHIIENEEQADKLKEPEVGEGRTGIYIEAIRKASELIKDRPIFAGVIGPFSLAGRLMDVSEAMVYCYEEPDMVHKVLDKATNFLIKYIKAYKGAGANGVVIAEPLAGLLSKELNKEFSVPYVKRIVEEVQDENFIIIYHNCGNETPRLVKEILGTGCAAYHFGNAIKMKEMLNLVPSETVVMGNIDPSSQFMNGTEESIRKETIDLMNECCGHCNFVISSGCDIPPLSRWANIDSFFKAVDEYYNRQ